MEYELIFLKHFSVVVTFVGREIDRSCIDHVSRSKMALATIGATRKGESSDMYVTLLAALVTASVALTVGIMNYLNGRRTLKENRLAERRKAINSALSDFYGPLHYYLNVSNALFRMFVKDKPREFRTLTYLLDPHQVFKTESGEQVVTLSDSDKKLLEEIIEITKKVTTHGIFEVMLLSDSESQRCF